MNTSPAPTSTAIPAGFTSRVRDGLRDGARAVASLVVTPLLPADYLDLLAPSRSRTDLRAKIVAIRPETTGAATIVLRPGPAWQPHLPGQYLRIGVDVNGVRQWRAYSITSAPNRPDGLVTITVKAIEDGTVSCHLVRDTRVGTVVQLEQATGAFTLPEVAPAKTLFVVAGSGVTPVMSMLRSRLDELDDAVVVLGASTETDAIFGSELQALAATGQITLIERFSDCDGRIDADTLAALVPDLGERETWACGPAGLLDAIEARWESDGRADLLHVERFRPTVVEPGEGGTVAFLATDREVEVDGSTSLLDAGEAAGVLMPSGCRMGICFGCVAPLRSGAVRDLRTGEVTTASDGDDISVQTCINTAASACQIDL